MPDEIKKCPKFQCGQRVLVRSDEAGMPPVFEAFVCCVDTDRNWHPSYTVESKEFGRIDGYTDEWLTEIGSRSSISLETAQVLITELNRQREICIQFGWPVVSLDNAIAAFNAEKGRV